MSSIILLLFLSLSHSIFGELQISAIADLGGPLTTLEFPMLKCIGSSHGSMYLWEAYRNHVRAAQRDIGFEFIRGHGLLNDDLSVYLDGQANLWVLFNVMDFLRSINMRPIFELSFTPGELASSDREYLHYRANISPPTGKDGSYDEWSAFMKQLLTGLIARYGAPEVRQWKFELYNEPNCGFFSGDQAEYFRMYNATSFALKSVDPLVSVGGPATCALGWLESFLGYVAAAGSPTDIVTTHLYPTDDCASKDREGFSAVIAEAAVNITRWGRPGMKLVMTEFNAGLGLPTEVNGDTAHSASFVLHNSLALQGVENLEVLSYWSVSDIFEEGGVDSSPWHNGYGIQNVWGVPKPVYRGFQMLSQLPRTAVPVSFTGLAQGTPVYARKGSGSAGDIDIVVGVDASSPTTLVTALLTNYNIFSSPPNATTVTLTFSGIPANSKVPSTATLELIDSTQ